MSDFTEAVEHYLDGLEAVSSGPCPGCAECAVEGAEEETEEWYGLAGEPYFSWSPCECCGSHLGGDRHPAHGLIKGGKLDGKLVHMDVCTDCLFYLANGDEPEEWR